MRWWLCFTEPAQSRKLSWVQATSQPFEALGWALGYAKAESGSLGSGDSCYLLRGMT